MENLKHILDLTYELEGLVELALRRTDVRASLIPLITDKIRSLAETQTASGSHSSLPHGMADTDYIQETDMEECIENEQTDTADLMEDTQGDTQKTIPDASSDPQEFQSADNGTPIGHLPFSINDKFRFRRELFGNDNTRYAQSLELIATMTSLEEVSDYLCNDLELEEDSEEVKAFLERVKALSSL